jgi:hypothetical protein
MICRFEEHLTTLHTNTGYSNKRREAMSMADGSAVFTGNDAYTSSVTILLNEINSFLYQLVLAPLYSMIALQKSIVCTTNDVFALFNAAGFRIRLGRPDLQAASDVSAGVCMTSFFAEQLDGYMETNSAGLNYLLLGVFQPFHSVTETLLFQRTFPLASTSSCRMLGS